MPGSSVPAALQSGSHLSATCAKNERGREFKERSRSEDRMAASLESKKRTAMHCEMMLLCLSIFSELPGSMCSSHVFVTSRLCQDF